MKKHSCEELGVCQSRAECHGPCSAKRHPFAPGVIGRGLLFGGVAAVRPVLPHNQQLLDFIEAHQPIGLSALFARFDGAGENFKAFSARLHYLKAQGWLLNAGASTRAVWSRSSERPSHTLRPKVVAQPAAAVGQTVPPRQYDYMRGPVYQPAACATPRAGAFDFLQLASHGHRC
jgi:hypothetical protein